MKIICKTGEIVFSLENYYRTKHWSILTLTYLNSDLSKTCSKCQISCIPSHFLHRTKTRIGKEKLTDILPVCSGCIDSIPKRSKKKAERRLLAPLGFNAARLTDAEKRWYLSIKPYLRGHVFAKHFSNKAASYKPSKQWINSQIKKVCKWIRRQEKIMMKNVEFV